MLENVQTNDIDRMIAFIKQEAQSKVEEIQSLSSEEYHLTKSRLTKARALELNNAYLKAEKEESIIRIKQESKIKSEFNNIYLEEKDRILCELMDKVKKKLLKRGLKEHLVSKCLEKMPHGQEIEIYCLNKDKEVVEKVLRNKSFKYSIISMDESCLGGVVARTKDRSVISDCSYATRLDIIRQKHMDRISVAIFDKKI
ncbi:V-type proton ATPase subunit E 1 [Astathelohania contejeani]|uniref:V-type proton ATPase subunit E 1 n=1 Tax=Astathelohania contejeani TaxID=164912 RepID=A0ABQ7I2S5_9MICR|nr:V-type proton ATPase subunit E 1 [Thelohania contejeani]